MKKLLVWVGVILVLLLSISAVTVYRIRDIKGDMTGAPTLRQELNNRYLKTVADTTFVKISDGFQLHDSIYFKDETYTKQQIQALPTDNQLVVGLRNYGSTIKALPFGVTLANLFATQTTLADGVYYTALFEIKDTITVTGVGWVQQTQGSYTADNYNGVAIYTVSGGTDTKLVETVNDGNIWKAVAGSSTKAFPTTQILLPGNYKISALWNASATPTAPIVYAHTTVGGNITYLLPNNQKISATLSAQTSMPASVVGSSLTSVSNYLGIWLY